MSACFNRWDARGKAARRLCLAVVVLFCIITPVMLIEALTVKHIYNDFYAFHSYSEFIRTHPVARIYVDQDMRNWQAEIGHGKYFPYFYPPTMLLLVWPLAYLPYDLGYALWSGLTLMAYLAVVTSLSHRMAAAFFAALVAPSTLLVVFCGQSSCLAAALLFAGFGMLRSRPLLAGILFGLLAYKPQLGLLVPVALAATGQWRTIVAAAATVFAMVVASSVVFGWTIWLTWLHATPDLWHVFNINRARFAPIMTTVSSNLFMFGAGDAVTHAVQFLATAMSFGVVWFSFRRDGGPLSIATLAVAAFLATPYAFGYDLPVLTAAIITVAADRWKHADSFSFPEIFFMTAAYMLPFCLFAQCTYRFSSVVVAALLWLITVRVHFRANRGVTVGNGMTAIGAPWSLPTA